MKKIVVIGNARFVVDCLDVMRRTPTADVRLVMSDPKIKTMGGLVEKYCLQNDLPYLETTQVNSDETLARVEAAQPDLIFSLYNMRILKKPLLSIPKEGTINYHNSPLPKYRGVNIYSWAIINGENEHGVTWHWVDEGIDTGDILGQKTFPLADDETPFTMARKCFRAGVEVLKGILEPLLAGQIQATPQDHSRASYYSFKDTPNEGQIDFTWPFERIERFVRGLDFRPMENTLAYPTVHHDGTAFHPQKVVRLSASPQQPQPGAVESIDQDVLGVRVEGGVVGLTDLLDHEMTTVSPPELADRLGIRVGDRLKT